MCKGTYNVNSSVRPSKDGSFRSMLCAILIFFTFCIIILLAAWPWKSGKKQETSIKSYADNQQGSKYTTTSIPTTKLLEKMTSSPTTKLLEKLTTTSSPTTKFTENFNDVDQFDNSTLNNDTKTPVRYSNYNSTTINPNEYKTEIIFNNQTTFRPITESTTAETAKDNTTPGEDNYKNAFDKEVSTTTEIINDLETSTEIIDKYKPNLTTTIEPFDTTIISGDVTTKSSFEVDQTTTEIIDLLKSNLTTTEPFETTIISDDVTTKSSFAEDQTTTEVIDMFKSNLTTTTKPFETTIILVHVTTNSSLDNFENVETTTTEVLTTTLEDLTTEAPLIDIRLNNLQKTTTTEINQMTTTENVETTTQIILTKEEIENDLTTIKTTNEATTEMLPTTPIILIKDISEITTSISSNDFKNTTDLPKEEIFENKTDLPLKTTTIPNHYSPMERADPDSEEETQTTLTNTFKHIENKDLCNTPICKKISSRILAQMNHENEACEDFYDFSCGGLQIDNEEEEIWKIIKKKIYEIDETDSISYKIFKKYYDTCLEFHTEHFYYDDRILFVQDVIKTIDHFDNNDDDTKLDDKLTILLANMLKHDYAPIFDISVDVDKESKQFIFQLNLGRHHTILDNENEILRTQKKCLQKIKHDFTSSYHIDMNNLYDKYITCKNNYSDYLQSIEKTNFILNITYENIIPKINFILNKYMNLPKTAFLRTVITSKKYVIKKISELNFHFPLINWKKLFSLLVNKEVNDEDLVQVYFEDYFRSLFTRKSTLTKGDLYQILISMYANNLFNNIVTPLVNNPNKFCLHQTTNLLPEVAFSIYLKSLTTANTMDNINLINNLFYQLKKNLKETLTTAEWLEDNNSKSSVLMKLEKLQIDTNLEIWKNHTNVEKRIINYDNSSFSDYPTFSLVMITSYKQMLFNMWKETASNPEFIWSYFQKPYSKEFVSIYALNKIVIPPTLLLYTPEDIPQYITLAKIGYKLAKAIGQHFDATGIKFGMNLVENSKKAYQALRSCSATKFQQPMAMVFQGRNLTYQINDTFDLSLNDRIAEDMSLKLISDLSEFSTADKLLLWISDTYSRDKIFFIALAQEHCTKLTIEDMLLQLFENEKLPAPILLKMALSNLDNFKDTFSCKDGSAMYHPIQCPAFQDLETYEDEDEDY